MYSGTKYFMSKYMNYDNKKFGDKSNLHLLVN